jgi:tetratricopeptide (TPR) repeat protein
MPCVLEEARGLSPESAEGVVLLARAYSAVGRSDESMALLGEAAHAHRGRRSRALGSIYREMSRLQLEEGFLSEALQSLTRAFEMDMRNARLAMELGQLALDLDEDEVAARAFRAVICVPATTARRGVTPATRPRPVPARVQAARKATRAVKGSQKAYENPQHEQAGLLPGSGPNETTVAHQRRRTPVSAWARRINTSTASHAASIDQPSSARRLGHGIT